MTMQASSVPYAAELNAAYDKWGVDPALLQSLIEVGGTSDNICGIPDDAKTYANSYATNRGNILGDRWPEANIMAAAWWIVRLKLTYGDLWTAVKAYFEMSPVGEGKMHRIFNVTYPKWRKKFR